MLHERYEKKIVHGCGVAAKDIPWEEIDQMLLQRKVFLDRHGLTSEDCDLSVSDLALICAIAGVVKVPESATKSLEKEKVKAKVQKEAKEPAAAAN